MSGGNWRFRMQMVHAKVYRRDNWECQMPECLCPDGRAIDPGLRGSNDPWAPSIDHITELGLGGEDDLPNLRAAHRYCNAEYAYQNRHGTYGEQEPVVNNLGEMFPELREIQ